MSDHRLRTYGEPITVFSRVLHVKTLGEQRIELASTVTSKLVSVVKTTEHVAHCPVYTQRISLVLMHAKVRNFEYVVSKMQCEHATAFSSLHEHC